MVKNYVPEKGDIVWLDFTPQLVTATMTPYKTKTGPGITTCTEQRN
jgi:hypothetical protein